LPIFSIIHRFSHDVSPIGNWQSAIKTNHFRLGLTMAGYSATPLPKKLGIKENFRIAFLNAPESFPSALGELPPTAKILSNLAAPLDLVVLFVERESILARRFPALAKKLSAAGMIWVAWPKKSSGVKTDLAFENVQRIGLDCGLVDVKICAIDEIWSGLKFVYRIKDRKRLTES
jgi:hypothetical protein